MPGDRDEEQRQRRDVREVAAVREQALRAEDPSGDHPEAREAPAAQPARAECREEQPPQREDRDDDECVGPVRAKRRAPVLGVMQRERELDGEDEPDECAEDPGEDGPRRMQRGVLDQHRGQHQQRAHQDDQLERVADLAALLLAPVLGRPEGRAHFRCGRAGISGGRSRRLPRSLLRNQSRTATKAARSSPMPSTQNVQAGPDDRRRRAA